MVTIIRLFKVLVYFVVIYSPFAANVYAWGPLGHLSICDAAWRSSQVEIQKQLSATAKRMGYKTFAESCLWPDKIRKQKRYSWSGPLHYMNLRRGDTVIGSSPCNGSTGYSEKDRPQCVMSAIAYYQQRWLTPTLSIEERDEALLFMSHFVGDIHQPLHVSYADDRGGTQRQVIFNGKLTSLHRLWDGDILYCGTRASWRTLGKQLYRQHKQYSLEGRSSPEDWASESFALTRSVYAGLPKTLSADYCKQFHPVAMTRLALASVRLSTLLNKKLNTELNTTLNAKVLSETPTDSLSQSAGEAEADEVQSAPNLTSKFSDLWKLILTLLP
ncbi:MAG: S1/P1 nuclease [Cellvibrionaceae bacterium]